MTTAMKKVIVGLDLSFNSTGMTMGIWEGQKLSRMQFHRIVYDKEPKPIKNINQHTYRMPLNVDIENLIQSGNDDFYTEDQAFITVKAMVATKRLMKLILDEVTPLHQANQLEEFHVNIEGFIMPSMANGANQLRVLGGLIMFQGLVRAELIRLKLTLGELVTFGIVITSPSELKSFFANDGDASKFEMLEAFLDLWDGEKLLPETSSLANVNDVVDSFALMAYCHYRQYTLTERKMTKAVMKQEERAKKRRENTAERKVIFL